MPNALQALFHLHHSREEFLLDASNWSSDDLLYRTHVGGWCALDVLDHLQRVEGWAARDVSFHAREGSARNAPLTAGQIAVLTVMWSPLRVKIPAGSDELHPNTPTTLEDVAKNWRHASLQLEHAIGDVPKDRGDRAVFCHPIAGWMSPAATIRFLVVHLKHHQYQWNRLRKAVACQIR